MIEVTQKTIDKAYSFSGIGVHSGEKCEFIIKPLPPNSGIFLNDQKISISSAQYGELSTIVNGVRMVEHLLGFLLLSGVTNCSIQTLYGSELPIFDGSASTYLDTINIVQQDEPLCFSSHPRIQPFKIKNNNRIYRVTNEEDSMVSITIQNSNLLPVTKIIYLSDKSELESIIRSRTFCFKKDVSTLRERGLIRGGTEENAMVIEDEHDFFQKSDSILHHKALDFFGDFAILGIPLNALSGLSFHLVNPGHESNLEFDREFHKNLYT